MAILHPESNPLFPVNQAIDINDLKSPTVFNQKRPSPRKIISRLTRGESAADAVDGLAPGVDVFGFTKGQFSLLELLAAINAKIGPCHLTLSTWTAANADLDIVASFLESHKLRSARFILDFTFQRRQPAIAQKLRETFGFENVVVTRTHAKFALMQGPKHRLTVKTSMNLNTNPRFEDFDISWDADLYQFIETICAEVFTKTRTNQAQLSSNALQKQFQEV